MYTISMRSPVPLSCCGIAPKPIGLASEITHVGASKRSQAKAGAPDSASFKASNAFVCSFPHDQAACNLSE